ncbi:hypothetical protein Tco_0849414 [Tanacetum coccineum]
MLTTNLILARKQSWSCNSLRPRTKATLNEPTPPGCIQKGRISLRLEGSSRYFLDHKYAGNVSDSVETADQEVKIAEKGELVLLIQLSTAGEVVTDSQSQLQKNYEEERSLQDKEKKRKHCFMDNAKLYGRQIIKWLERLHSEEQASLTDEEKAREDWKSVQNSERQVIICGREQGRYLIKSWKLIDLCGVDREGIELPKKVYHKLSLSNSTLSDLGMEESPGRDKTGK